jgi:CubicO group peptidase (beta-lactamase class C family)
MLAMAWCACVAPRRALEPRSAAAPDASRMSTKILRVTSDLLPKVVLTGTEPERRSLEERMQRMHVPGVSIAVADQGRIAWARGYGIADTEKQTPVTLRTLFEAGSIWKAINATLALRLVDRKRLALDVDVNNYLRAWKVPENDYTREAKVTLRRLLSHTAGFNSTEYASSQTIPANATLIDLLEGRFSAGGRAVRVESVPGSETRYSNGGALVAQLALEDVTGEPLDQLAKELVFDPLRMEDTTYQQPLPPDWEARTAAAHDAAGQRYAGRHVESLPMTHLWTTPSDLLRWAMGVAAAYTGQSEFLSHDMAQQMLTPVLEGEPFALGTFVWGTGDDLSFWHGGRVEGAAAEVVYRPARRQGAAVMVNGDAGAYLSPSLLQAIGREYGWPGSMPQELDFKPTPPELVREAAGTYVARYPKRIELTLRQEGESLFVECFKLAVRSRAALMGANQFITLEEGLPLELERDETGRTHDVKLHGFVFTRMENDTSAVQRRP